MPSDFIGRSDLGAHGTEPSDSLDWVRSLARQPTDGRCACGAETSRIVAHTMRQFRGRLWHLVVEFECADCARKIERALLARSLQNPELLPELRRGYTERLQELNGR